MNIYTEDNQEMKMMMRSFTKTQYGKIMFLLSYALFFMFLIATLMVLFLFKYHWRFPFVMAGFSLITLISFIIGSVNYYNELRKYIMSQKK